VQDDRVSSDCVLRCTCCQEWEVEAVTLHQPPARPKSFLRIRHLGYVDREFSRFRDAEAFLKRKGLLAHLTEVQREAHLILDPSMRRSGPAAPRRD
jgi:hypothetical protein